MWDRYKIAVINILEKEKAIRLSDLIEKVSKELNEDKKKVKNAIDYRLKNKWGREIFFLNCLRKKGHTAIKIIFLPGNESIAEDLCSNLANRMRPREIKAAFSHFEEIKYGVLSPLKKIIPYIRWNGIFTFYFSNHDMKRVTGAVFKRESTLLPSPKKLKDGELEEYIGKYPIFIPFHRAMSPIDRDLLQDFVSNHLKEGKNPIKTFEELKEISLEFFSQKELLLNKIDSIILNVIKKTYPPIEPLNDEGAVIIWRLFFYSILREYLVGDKKRDNGPITDLDIIGNKILCVDAGNILCYPLESWYLLFISYFNHPKIHKKIGKIDKFIIKLVERGDIPEDIKNLFFELEDILDKAEKVKNKLLREIYYYFDSKHLVGICDKI